MNNENIYIKRLVQWKSLIICIISLIHLASIIIVVFLKIYNKISINNELLLIIISLIILDNVLFIFTIYILINTFHNSNISLSAYEKSFSTKISKDEIQKIIEEVLDEMKIKWNQSGNMYVIYYPPRLLTWGERVCIIVTNNKYTIYSEYVWPLQLIDIRHMNIRHVKILSFKIKEKIKNRR